MNSTHMTVSDISASNQHMHTARNESIFRATNSSYIQATPTPTDTQMIKKVDFRVISLSSEGEIMYAKDESSQQN